MSEESNNKDLDHDEISEEASENNKEKNEKKKKNIITIIAEE